MKLRVATYNIHKGISVFGNRSRIHEMKQAIHAMEADIVFLQEVQGRHDLHAIRNAAHWPQQGQHEFLAGESHYCAYGMNAVYDHGHHGNALLSKFPIIDFRNQDISDHAYEQRGILHCILHAGDVHVHCYVVHFGLFAGGRKRQAKALIDAVSASAPIDAPVIIAGDFNDWGDELSDALRVSLGVMGVFDEHVPLGEAGGIWHEGIARVKQNRPARTYPSMLPLLRLDRIYLRGIKPESAQVLHGAFWARLSDHAPIISTVEII